MTILQQRVRLGQIRSPDELQTAYRQLSKHLHPDLSGLHPSHFALLQADRIAAEKLLEAMQCGRPSESGSSAPTAGPVGERSPGEGPRSAAPDESPRMPGNSEQAGSRSGSAWRRSPSPGGQSLETFWELFGRYIDLGYPRSGGNLRDSLPPRVATAAAEISPDLARAFQIFDQLNARPDVRVLDVMPIQRAFYLGVENLLRYRREGSERSHKLAVDFLGEVLLRIRRHYENDAVSLYPLTVLLLHHGAPDFSGKDLTGTGADSDSAGHPSGSKTPGTGTAEGNAEPHPLDELYSLAMLRWKTTAPAAWLDGETGFTGGPAGDYRHQLTAVRAQLRILLNCEGIFALLSQYGYRPAADAGGRPMDSTGMLERIYQRRKLLSGIEATILQQMESSRGSDKLFPESGI